MARQPTSRLLPADSLTDLIAGLRDRGYDVIGPTVRDGAIVYDRVHDQDDLPRGWTDEQEAGHYRLRRRSDDALFGYAVGPHSWKKWLHPPRQRIWSADRTGDGFSVTPEPAPQRPLAFLGVRGCELAAIRIQDKVFLGSEHTDPRYASRREGAFLVAVQCAVAGGTCFCTSMDTGPAIGDDAGADLVLTELLDDGRHVLHARAGTDRGAEVLAALPGKDAAPADETAVEGVVAATAASMGRELQTDGLPQLIIANQDHPNWDTVAEACLDCANCTLACPTCFCTTVEDTTDLSGDHAERWQQWDSCFTTDFTHVVGGAVRASPRSRYRQWLTHKLATWHDQFGSSGCVGCGRCITWCPVGIDITREAARLRETTTS